MENATAEKMTPNTPPTSQRIYSHKKKDEWGYAILAYEREDRRGYQFQDGELRKFKKGYYHMLEPVAPPDAPRIVKNLKSMMKEAAAVRETVSAGDEFTADVDFGSMHTVFKGFYADGFADAEYLSKVRGRDAKRRIKRHRDAAIADARQKLSVDALHRMDEAGQHTLVRDTLVDVLTKTDLVTKKKLEPLSQLGDEDCALLTKNLRAMLYGQGPYEARFERFVRVLERSGKKVSWSLATAPASLVHPTEHLFVKGNVFKQLVDRFAPTIGWGPRPNGWLYGRLLGTAEDIRDSLEKAGDAPRDLHDVSWLVWTVMRPKGREQLDVLTRRPLD